MKQNYLRVLLVAVLTVVLVFSLAGCHAAEKMDEAVNGTLGKVQDLSESEYSSAQEIVDEYANKMTKKAEALGKELKKEAPAAYAKDGTLANLLKEKTSALTDLYGEGSKEISTYVLYTDDSESPTPYTDALYEAYKSAESILMDNYQEALRAVKKY